MPFLLLPHKAAALPGARRQRQSPLPFPSSFLPPRTRRYCVHSSRGPRRARSLTMRYGDVGLHFVLSATITTVSISHEAKQGRSPAPPPLGMSPARVPPVRLREGGQCPLLRVWDGERASWEIDGPECCEHNEVIPPSRASSIPRLRRGVPTATDCRGRSPGVWLSRR